MFGIDELKITFSFNLLLFVLALILFVGFTYFAYRYTVPQISSAKKILLIIARVFALGLLLLAIFEPTLTLVKKNVLKPISLFFIDNSRSILSKDGTEKNKRILVFLDQLSRHNLSSSSMLKSFGSRISDLPFDSLNLLLFNEGSTNFSKIFNEIPSVKENLSSIVIVSDGVITDGLNPIYSAEAAGIPIFTVGVGDTAKRKDVEIKNVSYNEFIYAENSTTISPVIVNEGFANSEIMLSFYENDALIERQNLALSSSGVQNVQLSYTPKTSGEKKLTVALSNVEGEYTTSNNRKIFYINVLSNKVKVLLLSGSPSPDLSFIKNTLLKDENLSVNSITQIGINKYLEKNISSNFLDSAEILILIGFPSKETSPELLRKVVSLISEKNIPYLFLISTSTDFNLLSQIKKQLPFTYGAFTNNYLEVQPIVSPDQIKHPLLQSGNYPITAWNSLPPVFQPLTEFSAKYESEVIAKSKINNVPTNKSLILTRTIGSQRSIAILARDIWKWKLQTALKSNNIFDSFILNSIKWLNSPEDIKRIQIKTLKKLYALGEEVEFSAQIYDDSFNPVSDAEVKVVVKNENERYELNLSSLGNGLYEGVLQTNKPGNYSFTGEAKINDKPIGSDKGLFNIGEIDIEMINTRLDYEFLSSLANVSNGVYFNIDEANKLFNLLMELNEKSSKEKIETKEYSLWSNEFLLMAIILLFALEWFVRKREGML